uniref:Uncharacterized protein n=1 Tax=Sphaerodactylus townsendi TaxID=933632 RepID=A0ACB8G7V8_9SAUR
MNNCMDINVHNTRRLPEHVEQLNITEPDSHIIGEDLVQGRKFYFHCTSLPAGGKEGAYRVALGHFVKVPALRSLQSVCLLHFTLPFLQAAQDTVPTPFSLRTTM